MLFSGCAFFIAAISALALASPNAAGERGMPLRLGRVGTVCVALFAHGADEHRHILRQLGSGVDRTSASVTIRPSTVGDQPTRGVAAGVDPGPPRPRRGGFILAMTAFPAAINLAHSIFCSEVMSLGCNAKLFHHLPRELL